MTDEVFFAKHDADPNSVYMVTVYPQEHTAVFSTKALADAWVSTFPEECPAVVTTRVIDAPEYGNTPKGQQQ